MVVISIGGFATLMLNMWRGEKEECYREIVMAAQSLKNAVNDSKKPSEATKSTAQMAQLI